MVVHGTANHYRGKAGNLYVEGPDGKTCDTYDVWLEDFCIIGTGPTEVDALWDAQRHALDIAALAESAIGKVTNVKQP